MKMRNVPLKNYIVLFLLILGTVFLVFYLRSWYNTSKEYYQNNSIMSRFLSQLKSNEIHSYIIDNPTVLIYYASAKDLEIKSFEKELKKLIEEYEIKDQIVYIDSAKEENNNFISQLNDISEQKINDINIPNLIFVKDGKINKILYSDSNKINKYDVKRFLIKCGVITND